MSVFSVIWPVHSYLRKYFRSRSAQITSISLAVSSHLKGRSRSSRTRGEMRWTQAVLLTRARDLRTAKSCGPDASTLAFKLATMLAHCAYDGDKKARSPGRARRKPLKPLRAGMPGDPGATVVSNSCAYYFCTRGRGCGGHPAFPTPSVGRMIHAQLGRYSRRGIADSYRIAFWLGNFNDG
jgi:hypothetical protein